MVKSAPLSAVPQLGACASSGCAWRLWAARHSYGEARPLGSQPLPRVLEPAASKVADSTASSHPGVRVADKPGSFNGTFLRLSADREPSRPYPLELGDAFGLGCVGPVGLGHWLTLVAEEGEYYLQAR